MGTLLAKNAKPRHKHLLFVYNSKTYKKEMYIESYHQRLLSRRTLKSQYNSPFPSIQLSDISINDCIRKNDKI